MLVHLLGKKELDFSAQGEQVKGIQLFFSFKEIGVDGEKCDKLFLRDGAFKLPPLQVGAMLNIGFTNKGKPESIELAK